MSENLPMKTMRGPLTPDEREYYRHVASFNAITQGDRLTVQPCRDVLALDDALRAALERAEKAEARYDECSRDLHHTTTERDAALAKLKDIEDMLACVWGTDVAADARDIGGRVKRTATGWTTGERITPRQVLK